MWNKVSSNRILNQRQKQQAHFRHLRALRNIKPSINNAPPSQYSFLNSRPKKKQQLKQRNNQIDKQNKILVTKMLTSPSIVSGINQVFIKDSMNTAIIRNNEKNIDRQNQDLVKRLQSASSVYSKKNMQKSLNCYKKTKSNMAYSRMDPYYDLDAYPRKPSTEHCEKNFVRPYSAKR